MASVTAPTNVITKRDKPPHIIISGAPASGKGTQCEYIQNEFNVVHLSTGDMLRSEVSKETDLGLQAKEFMNQGLLVPDEIMIEMILNRIKEPDCIKNGWLLDGFPRTEAQAEAMNKKGITCDVFIHLDVPDEALVERVVGRRNDPVTGKIYHMKFNPPPEDETVKERLVHRADDTEEKVKTRIGAFHKNMSSLLKIYKEKTLTIDGNRHKNNIWNNVYTGINRNIKFTVVFVLGGPKSGKSSYCQMLSTSFGYHYLTNEALEKRCEDIDTADSAALINAIDEEMTTSLHDKFILDAFPRNAQDLSTWMEVINDKCVIDHVVYLECPEDLATKRMKAANPEISDEEIRNRFHTFENNVKPLIATFKWLGKIRNHTAVDPLDVGFTYLSKYFQRKFNTPVNMGVSVVKSDAVIVNEGKALESASDAKEESKGAAHSMAKSESKWSYNSNYEFYAHPDKKDSGNDSVVQSKHVDDCKASDAKFTDSYDSDMDMSFLHQRTLAIIKPDVVLTNRETHATDKIFEMLMNLSPFEEPDIKIVSCKCIQMSREMAENFYYKHINKPFYNDLIDYMTSGPCVTMILDGPDAIIRWRALMGSIDDRDSLRGMYGTDILHNGFHGSDSESSSYYEIDYYTRDNSVGTTKKTKLKLADYGVVIPQLLRMPKQL